MLVGGSGCVSDSGRSGLFGFAGKQPTDSKQLSPEFREAQKTFRRNTPKAILAWARYQEDVGEYAEALRRYRELSIAYPENIEAQLGMARVENATGRFQQSEEILRKLAKDYPDNTQIHLELGHLYSQREDWNAATLAFEQACKHSPHDQVCRYELGVALARKGAFDAALPHLTFAVGQSAAHYNIGYILHEEGRESEAAEWLTAALSMHPDPKTADQARKLLAKMPETRERDGVVAAAARDEEPESLPRAAERADTGVRQASWTAPVPSQSRLRTVRESRPSPSVTAGRAPVAVESEEPASAVRLPSPQKSVPNSSAAGGAGPLQPPQWRPAKPVSR
jgi:tetratricopeptide (TPR) repeat protein